MWTYVILSFLVVSVCLIYLLVCLTMKHPMYLHIRDACVTMDKYVRGTSELLFTSEKIHVAESQLAMRA